MPTKPKPKVQDTSKIFGVTESVILDPSKLPMKYRDPGLTKKIQHEATSYKADWEAEQEEPTPTESWAALTDFREKTAALLQSVQALDVTSAANLWSESTRDPQNLFNKYPAETMLGNWLDAASRAIQRTKRGQRKCFLAEERLARRLQKIITAHGLPATAHSKDFCECFGLIIETVTNIHLDEPRNRLRRALAAPKLLILSCR